MGQEPLEELLTPREEARPTPKPQIFKLETINDQQELQNLFTKTSVEIHDILDKQLLELVITRNPSLSPLDPAFMEKYQATRDELIGDKPSQYTGIWVYLPWKHVLVHLLPEALYFELRTAYNRQLITTEEQDIFRQKMIGVAGLSDGNSAAIVIALQGGCQHMRLADTDTLAVGNTNRIRAGIDVIGEYKTHLTAQQIYELDPFADLTLFYQGITEENVSQFLGGPPKLDLVIDEVDNLHAKVILRLEARRLGVPVISAVHNEDCVIIDIERYDLDPSLPIFGHRMGDLGSEFLRHTINPLDQARLVINSFRGRMGDIDPEFLRKKMNPADQARLIAKFIGTDNLTPNMQQSLRAIGKTIYAQPQLASSVAMSGAVLGYLTRQILLGRPIKSGRRAISLDSFFVEEYNEQEQKDQRRRANEAFFKELDVSEDEQLNSAFR